MTSSNVIPFSPGTRVTAPILTSQQIADLRSTMDGRLISCSFGSGVDSTAYLVALHEAGIRPDVITFADTGGEKRITMDHLEKMQKVVQSWGWPAIDVCVKKTLESTKYNDLYGNCVDNETLPSLAFGMHSCSIKWKLNPQQTWLTGAKSGPNKKDPHPLWIKATEQNVRILTLIGYDSGKADMSRSKKPPPADSKFDYFYPLQMLGWEREDCVRAIEMALGASMVPTKSACYFCPASKIWELYWLAAHEPDLLEKALVMERKALTGRHSRFDEVEFGASWEEMVKTSDRFPSTKTCVGLGRTFAWNQWARVNDVVDAEFKVLRSEDAKSRFLQLSAELQNGGGNAHDSRSVQTIKFHKAMPKQLNMEFA